jgi:hypothetical protein
MNNAQHEQLFTDLNPTQAETISAGGPLYRLSQANNWYGGASADIEATGPSSFFGSLQVEDLAGGDGYPVYAQFQGKLTENGPIFTGGTKFYDRTKGKGFNTGFFHGNFGKKHPFRYIRIAILRDNPGRDLFTAGNWLDFGSPS